MYLVRKQNASVGLMNRHVAGSGHVGESGGEKGGGNQDGSCSAAYVRVCNKFFLTDCPHNNRDSTINISTPSISY